MDKNDDGGGFDPVKFFFIDDGAVRVGKVGWGFFITLYAELESSAVRSMTGTTDDDWSD